MRVHSVWDKGLEGGRDGQVSNEGLVMKVGRGKGHGLCIFGLEIGQLGLDTNGFEIGQLGVGHLDLVPKINT